MPSHRLQAASSSLTNEELVQRAMMVSRCFRIWNSFLLCVTDVEKADLGMDRINELPLDDTPKKHVLPPRARRAPVNVENTEALNGYRGMLYPSTSQDRSLTNEDDSACRDRNGRC